MCHDGCVSMQARRRGVPAPHLQTWPVLSDAPAGPPSVTLRTNKAGPGIPSRVLPQWAPPPHSLLPRNRQAQLSLAFPKTRTSPASGVCSRTASSNIGAVYAMLRAKKLMTLARGPGHGKIVDLRYGDPQPIHWGAGKLNLRQIRMV